MKRNLILILVLAACAVMALRFFAAEGPSSSDSEPTRLTQPASAIQRLTEQKDLNIVFVLIDTLRADRLGAYGYERPTSSYIDQLSSRAIRFDDHLSHSSWTKTSMASIWTGLYPVRSGIIRAQHALPPAAKMPAEILSDEGFTTAAIWRNGWVGPTFGFDQGFDIYHKPQPRRSREDLEERRKANPHAVLAGSDIDITEGGIEFMRTHADQRFLLYLHYMDLHQYVSDEKSAVFGTSYSDLYDNAIHWTDRHVRGLVDALENFGLRERTIVVLASDHGEAFGEHGHEGHAKDLYSEVTRVPWIVILPFDLEEPVIVEAPTENVDIWPTLLDLLGLPAMDVTDGRSRVPEILFAAGLQEDESDRSPRYGQLDRSWGHSRSASRPILSVTENQMRLVRRLSRDNEPDEVFDLRQDPLETRNIAKEQPEVQQALSRRLDEYLKLASPESWEGGALEVKLDDFQKGQLRALGYVVE